MNIKIEYLTRKGNRTGLFLFLGSVSIELLKQSSESLAGRIAYTELYPLDVTEFAGTDSQKTNQLWLRGGFPDSLLSTSDKNSLLWRNDFIKTYLERDIPQLLLYIQNDPYFFKVCNSTLHFRLGCLQGHTW